MPQGRHADAILFAERLDDFIAEDKGETVGRRCRRLNLFFKDILAIDGRRSKAVSNRDRNFTPAKMERRRHELERGTIKSE